MSTQLSETYEINVDAYELVNIEAIETEISFWWQTFEKENPLLTERMAKQQEITRWQNLIRKHTYHKLY